MEVSCMIEKQLEHRTIRAFQEKEIPQDIFQLLMEVGRRTASSTGIQGCSIIRITDQKLKDEISSVSRQDFIKKIPELMIFVVDQYRNSRIAKDSGVEEQGSCDMDRFLSGYTDACITAQNIVNAAESIGLGTVYLGSILNDSEKICELLNLPKLTFPVVGLGIGYPDQDPGMKPRMDMKYRVFENSYKVFDDYTHIMKEYDKEMESYYKDRGENQKLDSFSGQVIMRLTTETKKRQEILNVIKLQDFQLRIKE